MSLLEDRKLQNKNMIKIGSCIELICLLDSFDSNFERLNKLIKENEFILNNQDLNTLLDGSKSLHSSINFYIFSIMNDIDRDLKYCDYMNMYY